MPDALTVPPNGASESTEYRVWRRETFKPHGHLILQRRSVIPAKPRNLNFRLKSKCHTPSSGVNPTKKKKVKIIQKKSPCSSPLYRGYPAVNSDTGNSSHDRSAMGIKRGKRPVKALVEPKQIKRGRSTFDSGPDPGLFRGPACFRTA